MVYGHSNPSLLGGGGVLRPAPRTSRTGQWVVGGGGGHGHGNGGTFPTPSTPRPPPSLRTAHAPRNTPPPCARPPSCGTSPGSTGCGGGGGTEGQRPPGGGGGAIAWPPRGRGGEQGPAPDAFGGAWAVRSGMGRAPTDAPKGRGGGAWCEGEWGGVPGRGALRGRVGGGGCLSPSRRSISPTSHRLVTREGGGGGGVLVRCGCHRAFEGVYGCSRCTARRWRVFPGDTAGAPHSPTPPNPHQPSPHGP